MKTAEFNFTRYDLENIYLVNIDRFRKMICLVLPCTSEKLQHQFLCNKKELFPAFYKLYARKSNLFYHILWFQYKSGDSFTATLNGQTIPIIYNDKAFDNFKLPPSGHERPYRRLPHRILAALSKLPFIRKRFSGCWLLADRDARADDNAEHLYRWIMKNHPDKKIFFALAKKSPDWERLRREGFKLINLQSLCYYFAWIHCRWLISSQTTNYVRKANWRIWYADLYRHQFCFLQHGITKDSMRGLNRIEIDMFVTATQNEYDSFVESPQYPYKFSAKEVQLTGFPRHDELPGKAKKVEHPKTILIMPTWRKNLVSTLIPRTGQYPYNPEFKKSRYFENWQAVLASKDLQSIAQQYGYSLLFMPHHCVEQQLIDFDLHNIALAHAGVSMQDILADTALLITDYSSIAMELAILHRPLIYFQFDRDTFFTGDHSYTKGYFDYERDGFGDIALTTDDLCQKVESCMKNNCKMDEKYILRADKFFTFNDQNNCKRVYEAILKVSEPTDINHE